MDLDIMDIREEISRADVLVTRLCNDFVAARYAKNTAGKTIVIQAARNDEVIVGEGLTRVVFTISK